MATKLTRIQVEEAIFDKLVWEDITEDLINTLNRDLTDKEGELVSEMLGKLEDLIDNYL